MRHIGTVARGIRLPVVMSGDDLKKIVVNSLMEAAASEQDGFKFKDRDIVGVTESLVARAQGNYVTTEDIAQDVARLTDEGDAVLLFPILSRNRFLELLKGIVAGVRGTLHLVLSYPCDEVGNGVMDRQEFYEKAHLLSDSAFDEDEFRRVFGTWTHPFTGLDYVELYKSVAPEKIKVHFAQSPKAALSYAKQVIVASIHDRNLHRQVLEWLGAKVITLDQICAAPQEGRGWNDRFGLLGSNYSRAGVVKLFPRDCEAFVADLQEELRRQTGRQIDVLVYGDGAFKDPVGGIWELADPVVSPACTSGLIGMPHEIKFKYVADNAGDKTPLQAVTEAIQAKAKTSRSDKTGLGTTPRRLSDLVGSLCDLVSGSGDKGTPVIYISGYFDSYIVQ
ncbi:coenzyme F420-0:L-glutamate ligase [Jonquetella anthropi]|uniref:coenzyme F420-0:L-glutamate ligase n=1 Tax=Jonquetella anthropi TaxID=428712 RepID=UPI0023F21D82|nr:coenzyme F420-0:L-glutamate ligase [Jonquetella anthropi]